MASSDNPHAAGTRSFSATFELHGNSETGQLTLFNPFGTTAASINWQPGSAELSAPGMSRKNGNLATLMQQQFGTELPMQALFAWLQGKKADVDSWRVDLSRWQEGKISALREVDPQVHVRLILEP